MLKEESEAVNGLTPYDYLMMRSAVEIAYDTRFQCGKCKIKSSEEVREARKGCTGKYPKKYELGGFTYRICPGNFYSFSYVSLLDLHTSYRKGVLFTAGGIMDQPTKYIDAMNFLEGLVSSKEFEQMERARKKSGRK